MGMQVDATRVALGELDALGVLSGTECRLLVAQVEGLAEQVDESPGNAALWGQYRAAWLELREVTAGDDSDREARELLARLGGTALGDCSSS